ncbi:MAG: ABC transporter substrate-binding protein [Alphaproteobacteria bacterium]|nr:ABC transporter substrate-binding protein [Alphaproteobacteria bacterium]NNF25471.1 ABC transporter substrate-binding protein [Paracoccaceae bacterium]RZV99952.1 MAG: ABC transporter substrate-binding protein [Paracoccaceae bacterium]
MSVKSKCLGAAAAALVASAAAAENQKVSFGTNWVAQAEHGGFYQAVADGTYADCGLDVTIIPGGPQVNNRALMLAGRAEFYMGGDLIQAFNAAKESVPIVTVAAMFQKHPQVILAHPGSASSWEDLKGLKILIADLTYQSVYQWMMAEHGFTAEQRGLYTFNPAPFLADKNLAMQGYLSSEPFLVAKEGGFEPEVFLIADAGYSTYATTIETMADTIENNPDAVQCFVDGSARGWYTYLYGDNTDANALIKEANPEMTDDKIAYAITQMTANGIVDSGDTETLGIGAITEEKVGDFYTKMVSAGVIEDGIDWKSAFTTRFANKGVGMELKTN